MRTTELNGWWEIVSAISNVFMRAIFRVHVEGAWHVPSQGPAIVAFNHVSVIDGPAVAIVVARKRRRESRFGLNSRALRALLTCARPRKNNCAERACCRSSPAAAAT